MDKYLGISYLKNGEPDWTPKQLQEWKHKECSKGNHLFDEVLGITAHYLYCDACGFSKDIKSDSL